MKVCIVGAGPAGMCLALGLSEKKHQITLLEKTLKPNTFAEDKRVYAISSRNVSLFQRLGVWEAILPHATAINTVAVKEYGSTHKLAFDESVRDNDPYGFMVPSATLRQVLHRAVEKSTEIDFQTGIAVTGLKNAERKPTLETSSHHITTDIVFASDGKFSTVKRILNLPEETFTYEHSAIVCNVAHEKPHENVALELFTDMGPLAFLPVEGNTSACVFSMNHQLAEAYLRQDPQRFLDKLYTLFPSYGKFTLASDLMSYPLSATLATESVKGCVMLCGDAAMSIHPVAGQGLNVGLKDIAAILDRDWNENHNIANALKRIHQERMPDRRSMLHFTDGIIRLFELSSPSISLARRAGLFAVEHIPPLKHFFAGRASR